jgi:hypothetical protein
VALQQVSDSISSPTIPIRQILISPLFVIFYFPDSNEISPDQDPKYQVLQDGTLMIENATDSDMGSYECMAKSPAGEVKSRSVHMKPITAASTSSTSVHNPAKGEILYNR